MHVCIHAHIERNVCVRVYIYIYIYTHTHTHIFIYINTAYMSCRDSQLRRPQIQSHTYIHINIHQSPRFLHTHTHHTCPYMYTYTPTTHASVHACMHSYIQCFILMNTWWRRQICIHTYIYAVLDTWCRPLIHIHTYTYINTLAQCYDKHIGIYIYIYTYIHTNVYIHKCRASFPMNA